MYGYIKMIGIYGLMVLSSALCNAEQYVDTTQLYKSETGVMLSLLHLDAMFSRLHVHNAACYRVCRCIKNNDLEDITEHDVQNMVTWMVQMLQKYPAAKGPSRSDEQQRLHDAIITFLSDCMICNAYGYNITKQNYGPCFSQLVANSLEACGVHVLGDLTVDGQIINPCCQGSSLGGPTGPTGPTGPAGPAGPRGTCNRLSDYLFATYFSTGFVGSDGNFILDSSDYLEIPAGQEAVIPLEINSSMTTSGWESSTGSSSAFVVPETGLYEISYQIAFVQPFFYNYFRQLLVAWIERNDGSESSQLVDSSVSYFLLTYGIASIAPLSYTFLANLNENEEITLVCANKGVVSGTLPIGTSSVIVVSGASSSIASSLVITKVRAYP